jgi:predicted PurR-regulated permease PerM
MVIVVIVINTFISLILLNVAWRVWKLKQQIAYVADRLTDYERSSHALLHKAPESISTGQGNIHNLRQQNQALHRQIQQVRQVISLLLLGRQIWQRYIRGLGFTFEKKT